MPAEPNHEYRHTAERLQALEAKVAKLEQELKERDEHIKGLLEAKASHIGILVELRSDVDELKSKLAIPTGPSALYRQMQALADQAEGNTEEEAPDEQ